ncbi:haloalkane dehalogenase [Halorientalis regularis]|jgi:haloalkane dehalogenase|nr:haloalkane dehalogenase [Halorientalis regularis]
MSLERAPAERFDDLPGYDYEANYVDVGEGTSPGNQNAGRSGDAGGPEMAYVDVEGDGDETFLCLHGEPTWSYLYRKMIPTLSEAGRVVVPDLIGFGRSDKWPEQADYTYSAMYDTVERFLGELDLQNVTLICQDWGGLLGLPVAANNPDRFARLVPMNTGLMDGSQSMPDIWHDFKDMAAEDPDFDVGQLVEGGCLSDIPDDVVEAYRAPFPDEDHMAGARILPSRVPTDPDMDGAETMREAKATFEEWEKPVFVLFSDSDPITHGSRDYLRDLFPTASDQPDIWIEGGAHFLQEDKGEEIAEEIVEFVERT